MVKALPHFLLFSAAEWKRSSGGRWRFVLESIDGDTTMEVEDEEPGLRRERLELLAVVRGLEALEQPSRVTLVTSSQRVTRGFRSGLEQWRSQRWCWERDGRWMPIKNSDLWQRVDRALQFHQVECRTWRVDAAHAQPPSAETERPPARCGRLSRPVVSFGRAWSRLARRLSGAVRPLGNWPSTLEHWGATT